ncbi:MAG: chemotaxis protein CheR [Betaproteobacteria bacterium]|nr:chemotaxis protein CheR [Betaproteobacteria bacterium]
MKVEPTFLYAPAGAKLGEPFRAFEFSDADFQRLQRMIYDLAGISLNEGKKAMAYSRLTKRIRALHVQNFAEYLDYVERDTGEEKVKFINALTTNLTYFFREPHHFPMLTDHLLTYPKDEPLTLWSAACSTGEEPYSMAMSIIDAFGTDRPPVKIIASDLDSDVLATAAKGVYPLEKIDALDRATLKRFFLKGAGDQMGFARVRPQVQRLVEFRQINLVDPPWNIEGPLAAIFCRNVMIYFNKQTQRAILERFAPLLKPNGLLFAGHSENFFYNARDMFNIRGKTVYELAA